mgnify:FL=1|jgi:hypothetical protein
MKKTKLRQIIRESIKELIIKEQFSGPNWDALQQAWSSSTPPSPPQSFINNMENHKGPGIPMGCGGMQSRMSHLYNKLNQQLGANTSQNAPLSGTNPLWQGQLASKIYWLINTGLSNCS